MLLHPTSLIEFKLGGCALLHIDPNNRPKYVRFDNIHTLLNYIKDSRCCLREMNHTILAKTGWFTWTRITLAQLRYESLLADKITSDEISQIYHFNL